MKSMENKNNVAAGQILASVRGRRPPKISNWRLVLRLLWLLSSLVPAFPRPFAASTSEVAPRFQKKVC